MRDLTGCYMCGRVILEPAAHQPNSGYPVAYGRVRMKPNGDYTCADVLLTNASQGVSFVTPICKSCVPGLTASRLLWDTLKKRVLDANREVGACLPLLDLPDELIAIDRVEDLTPVLIDEGVIQTA